MRVITKYFPHLSNLQKRQFSCLKDLYAAWNNKINLVSRKDIDNLYMNHVLHSLSIARFTQFSNDSRILDVGTGGGFPGIPLSILFPDVEFVLMDSIHKKIKVVNAIIQDIGITNVITECKRVEEFDDEFDFILGRAVTNMNVFKEWVSRLVSKSQRNELRNGILYLKGGDISEELSDIENVKEINISDYFEEEFFQTKKIVYISF